MHHMHDPKSMSNTYDMSVVADRSGALPPAPASASSPRSAAARSLIMRAAERLYATRGLAGVSIRQIGEAAGQRNKSAVQYHFTGRDALIKAVLAEHADAIERHRLAMMSALGDPAGMSLRDQLRCAVLPRIEHQIDLGTPSWYARFLAQIVVEPALRDHAVRAHLDTPSLRRLYDAIHAARAAVRPGNAEGAAVRAGNAGGAAVRAGNAGGAAEPAANAGGAAVRAGNAGGAERDPGATARREAMTRQLIVHMCAELETDLAAGRARAEAAAGAWRRLGEDLVTALCGMVGALDADDPAVDDPAVGAPAVGASGERLRGSRPPER
ncbi:TetR family transcriptional regulator [Nonomuraea sp. NPDC005501]|uniref:TetR/AcrR family transcriptional regulator n=1 Tax=Nonomuraea sp. NPDC005501 TaxID=3156884 RepID=UPI0033BF5001